MPVAASVHDVDLPLAGDGSAAGAWVGRAVRLLRLGLSP